MSSIPPPGWEAPNKEPDEPEEASIGAPYGPEPAANLDAIVDRSRAPRAGDAEPSQWEKSFAKGAEGEKKVAEVLEFRLRHAGAVVIHSQKVAPLGDIDHIVIGPGGVTIIDSKHWSGRVAVRGQTPRQNGYSRQDHVDKVVRQRKAVRVALAAAPPSLRNLNVQAVLCLAAEEQLPVSQLTDGVVLAGVEAAAAIAARGGTLSRSDVEAVAQVLLRQLGKVTRQQIDSAPTVPDGPLAVAAAPAPSPGNARTGRRVRQSTRVRSRSRVPSAKPGRKRRRARRGGRSIGSLLVAMVALVVALELAHYLQRRADLPKVYVTSERRHSVVYLTARSGDRIAISISAGRSKHHTELIATGAQMAWTVPRAWSHAPWITVSVCTLNAAGSCSGPLVTADDDPA